MLQRRRPFRLSQRSEHLNLPNSGVVTASGAASLAARAEASCEGGGERMKAMKIAPVQVLHMIYKAA
jgi:hypothetical protein